MTRDPGQDADSELAVTGVRQACTVLYSTTPPVDAQRLQLGLSHHVGPCRVEWAEPGRTGLPMTAGVAEFAHHRIAMVALEVPVSREVMARTVGVSPMPDDLRDQMLNHKGAIRLLYVDGSDEPVEQLKALYTLAEVLVMQGGIGVVNERAALGQPAELVLGYFDQLRGPVLPLPMWVGVVTYLRDETGLTPGFMMRTYGMAQFGLPELGMYFTERETADPAYHTLLNVGLYMIENAPGFKIEQGETAEFLGRTYLFTDPQRQEPEYFSRTGFFLLVQV